MHYPTSWTRTTTGGESQGCPEVPRALALSLIQELEGVNKIRSLSRREEVLNRSRRRRLEKKGGAVVHLFAGPEEGFDLSRAYKEQSAGNLGV